MTAHTRRALADVQGTSVNIVYEIALIDLRLDTVHPVYEFAELNCLRESVFFHKPSVKNFLSDKWMIPFSLRCVRYGVALITYFG